MTSSCDGLGDCVDFVRARLGRSDAMIHAQSRQLLAYWEALRGSRLVPLRSEVDPRDMDCDASSLFILESLGPENHRFRLAGTALVEAFGMELRGMPARSIMEGSGRSSLTALVAETLAEPGVGYARLTRRNAEPSEVWEILLLPLRTDYGAIERVLGSLVPVTPTRPRGQDRLRFAIETMSIRTVTGDAQTDLTGGTDAPAQGFAESAAFFGAAPSPAPEMPPRLQAIDGGAGEATGRSGTGGAVGKPKARPKRPHLRLVRDE